MKKLILLIALSIIPSFCLAEDDEYVPVTRAVMSSEYQAELEARKARRIAYRIQKGQDRHNRIRFRDNYAMYYYQAQLYAMMNSSISRASRTYVILDDRYKYDY